MQVDITKPTAFHGLKDKNNKVRFTRVTNETITSTNIAMGNENDPFHESM
jgi:hypothetical protein